MKPFLGIDITNNKNNEQLNGDEFLVATPSPALTASFERNFADVADTIEKSQLPFPLTIIKIICGIVGFLIVGGIFKAVGGEDELTFAEAYHNASWLFWTGGICLVICAILMVWGMIKSRVVLNSNESIRTLSHLDKNCDSIFFDLGIPADAAEADILTFLYKVKGGEIKVSKKALQPTPYITSVFHVFADSDNLYLANLEGKYAFPITSIKSIKIVKKHIKIDEWNKDIPYNKGIYKQYKLVEDNDEGIWCKTYGIVEIERNGEIWGIYIPSYELPVFENLLGIKGEK